MAAGGKTGGFSAPGGVSTKMRMLTIERARLRGNAPTDQLALFDQLPLAAQGRVQSRTKAFVHHAIREPDERIDAGGRLM